MGVRERGASQRAPKSGTIPGWNSDAVNGDEEYTGEGVWCVFLCVCLCVF